jgi:hypothetical protein
MTSPPYAHPRHLDSITEFMVEDTLRTLTGILLLQLFSFKISLFCGTIEGINSQGAQKREINSAGNSQWFYS